MNIKSLTKQDTLLFKAIGILLIMFHNYFHWVKPIIGENEFYFSSDCVKNLYQGVINTPLEIINLLFSYFGHYGVNIFIFISGIGLSISGINKRQNYCCFIGLRLKKLYSMILVGIIFYIVTKIFVYQEFPNSQLWRELLLKLLFINTLIPNQALSANGPWWFFSLIFQLYLLFPLLFKLVRKYNIKAFIIVCLISYIVYFAQAYLFNLPNGFVYMANSISHLPEFALGILLVFNNNKNIRPSLFIVSLLIFVLGNFYKPFFPFTFLAIL